MELSGITVTVLVSLAMLIFFRSAWATAALVLSLFQGTAWTLGLAYFIIGHLNANSAFLGSIVIGNGINFGIILLARYLEERRKGRNHPASLQSRLARHDGGDLTAALAAGLAYGSLSPDRLSRLQSVRRDRPHRHGSLLDRDFTLLPAYLTLLDRFKMLAAPTASSGGKRRKEPFSRALAYLVSKHPGKVWGVSFIITVGTRDDGSL